ncbi:PREDICTED: ileal sodium/bile acid cotransporter-like [Ceratosolen solmsi marchali]|uniref:Ileal sodium/bile acid cotransporter-like n=1 Tax=Ceratosolen solmsi marchali TaxID=326594 RepID=A0AAJ6YNE1_9HYME|nr:PREDICTED: ileal sodium/bile acid cotransporter-like [Ceratosolen solmsi marchali]
MFLILQIMNLLLGLLLVSTVFGEPKVIFHATETNIHMDEVTHIPFSIENISSNVVKVNLTAISSDLNVVQVERPIFDPLLIHDGYYNGSINATGIFLGKAELSMSVLIDEQPVKSDVMNIIVIRKVRVMDTIFTASVAILVSILYINFGCAMDWTVCAKTIKRPIGPIIGCLCQFILMPVISYVLAVTLFPESPEMQLGIFFTGISPSGGASNIWTILLGGNLCLSVTMTTLCTIAAFGLMPMWIFTLGKHIFDRGNLAMPYDKIATFAMGLIIPLALGYIIQKKLPKLSRILVRMMKPFSVILIVFIIIFAIITNLYLFKLFSWKIILCGMGLPWCGFIFGMLAAFIFCQPDQDIRAIAIETGIQNTGVSIFLLRFSLKQPTADLTTVIPVACAIMTPLPLIFLYIIKLMLDQKKQKLATSKEELQNPLHTVPSISTTVSALKRNQTIQL